MAGLLCQLLSVVCHIAFVNACVSPLYRAAWLNITLAASQYPCSRRYVLYDSRLQAQHFRFASCLPLVHKTIMLNCVWDRYGVSCCPSTPLILSSGCSTAFSQSVAVLELNNFNLSGTLPNDLGALQSLSAVTLSDNPSK